VLDRERESEEREREQQQERFAKIYLSHTPFRHMVAPYNEKNKRERETKRKEAV
jgi:hypothetical protein